MKKELKQLIKEKKLSDDEILKILQSYSESESEKDVKDEEDESEDQTDSEKSEKAEGKSAQKETPKKGKGLTAEDLTKMVAEAVKATFKAEKEANMLPSQKPLAKEEPAKKVQKPEPKPSKSTDANAIVDSNGNLIF